MGAWLAIAGVGIGVAFVVRRNAGASPAYTVEGAGTDSLDNTQPGAGNLGTVVPDSNPTAGQPAGGGVVIATNEDWAVAAQRALFAKGYDAATVNTAVRKYLNGDALTIQERAIIGLALIAVGPPPVQPPPPVSGEAPGQKPVPQIPAKPQPGPARPGLPHPVPAKPKPKPAPKPAKPKPTYYIVRPGDSLSKIAAKRHTTWQHLAQLNPQIKNPNLIFPGQRIRLS
jgi:nucleoid-associated protein YgaU